MKKLILLLLLLPLKHAWADDMEDEETTRDSQSITIKRLRKKRQLEQQHDPALNELPLNSLSMQQQQQRQQQQQQDVINIYDEFDFNRFLLNDASCSLPTLSPTAFEPVVPTTAPPITGVPTVVPTNFPSTLSPTPSNVDTLNPTQFPVQVSSLPTLSPTAAPIIATVAPIIPTTAPITKTSPPSIASPVRTTRSPTNVTTRSPTNVKTRSPTAAPVTQPVTPAPVTQPVTPAPKQSRTPTGSPTSQPILALTSIPTSRPVSAPTSRPVSAPTSRPTSAPTSQPVSAPTGSPTSGPTNVKTSRPTVRPTREPTNEQTPAPVQQRTLLSIVRTRPELQSFENAITISVRNTESAISSLVSILNQTSPRLMLFAPTNEAFSILEQEPFYADYLTPHYALHLFQLLAGHVFSPVFNTSDFPIDDIQNLVGGTVDVQQSDTGRFFVTSTNPVNARIVEPDVPASNGIAHIVDSVIWPEFINRNALDAIDNLGPDFSILRNFISLAGFEERFRALDNVSILVTPNNAYEVETERFFTLVENRESLQAYLLYQIIDPLFNFASVTPPYINITQTQQGEGILLGVVADDSADRIQVTFNDALLRSTFFSRDTLGCVVDRIIVPATLDNIIPRSLSGEVSTEAATLIQMASHDDNVFIPLNTKATTTETNSPRRRRRRKRSDVFKN